MTDITMSVQADKTDPNSLITSQKLEKLYQSCYYRLGGSSINRELLDVDYETAFDLAVRFYSVCSTRSVRKTFGFLVLKQYQQEYILPEEIELVTNIIRNRGFFATGAGFDPFNAATANLILRNARPESGFMGIATYDFYLQYENTLEKVFGRDIQYVWSPEKHSIYLIQMPKGPEQVVLECSVTKSYDELLNDKIARFFLENLTLAQLKMILGNKYGKFDGSIPSAQGGVTLGYAKLLEEGNKEWEEIEKNLYLYQDGGNIPLPTRG